MEKEKTLNEKKSRLLRKLYSKLFMTIATAFLAIYSLFQANDGANGPIWFMFMTTNGVLCVYFIEGVGRVRRRLNGKWL